VYQLQLEHAKADSDHVVLHRKQGIPAGPRWRSSRKDTVGLAFHLVRPRGRLTGIQAWRDRVPMPLSHNSEKGLQGFYVGGPVGASALHPWHGQPSHRLYWGVILQPFRFFAFIFMLFGFMFGRVLMLDSSVRRGLPITRQLAVPRFLRPLSELYTEALMAELPT
jgi:hypothetical protein